MQEIKYTLDGINIRLDIVYKMISELDIKLGTIQNEWKEKFHLKTKINRPSMSYATISSCLLCL